MTREEAVAVLKELMKNPLFSEARKVAFNIAIHDIKQRHEWDINNLILINKDNYEPIEQEPTTKNDLGDDCISRKAAEDITWQDPSYTDPLNILTEVRDKIKELPSVTPQEPRWIPVSDYLPVTNDEVLVTYIVNGNYKKRYVETARCFDGEWSSVNDEYRIPNTKIEIIAWCEMPKPYREVEE